MFYVYLLKSDISKQIYTGYTKDLQNRLAHHNSGKSAYTKKYKPWTLVAYFAFSSRKTAREFEAYLKTGSGIAFARKHFLNP